MSITNPHSTSSIRQQIFTLLDLLLGFLHLLFFLLLLSFYHRPGHDRPPFSLLPFWLSFCLLF